MIAVIDNGICNLRSVTKALEAVGAEVTVVREPSDLLEQTKGLVLPGVGALADCITSLRKTGFDQVVASWIKKDRPFLGVCLGMQALFDYSEEGEGGEGLSIFPGRVVKFVRPRAYKIPHMGWNKVHFAQASNPLVIDLDLRNDSFYFVHSFHCEPADKSLVLGMCDYGGPFVAALGQGRCFATQFHPEKSQAKGLQIYKNFVRVAQVG